MYVNNLDSGATVLICIRTDPASLRAAGALRCCQLPRLPITASLTQCAPSGGCLARIAAQKEPHQQMGWGNCSHTQPHTRLASIPSWPHPLSLVDCVPLPSPNPAAAGPATPTNRDGFTLLSDASCTRAAAQTGGHARRGRPRPRQGPQAPRRPARGGAAAAAGTAGAAAGGARASGAARLPRAGMRRSSVGIKSEERA